MDFKFDLEEEKNFKAIVDALPQLISYVDSELIYRYVNKNYEEFFGISRDDIVGKHIKEVIGNDVFKKARNHIDAVLKGQKVRYHEEFNYGPGQLRNIDGNLIPDFDQSGKVRGYYGVLTDVTPYVKARSEIIEKEALQSLILDNISDAVYLTSIEGDFVFISPNVDVVFEYSRQEIEQMKNISGLFNKAIYHKDDLYERKELQNIETRIHTKSSKKKTILVNVKLVNIGGEKVLITCRDITERKTSQKLLLRKESFLKTAEDLSHIGSWEWDVNTGKFILSAGYQNTHQFYKDITEFEQLSNLIHPDDMDKVNNAIEKVRKNKKRSEVEYRVIRGEDKAIRKFRSNADVILDDSGNVTHMIGTSQDITEQKEALDKLIESEARFRSIFNQGHLVKLLIDPSSGKIADANEAAVQFYGYEKDKLLSLSIFDINIQSKSEIIDEMAYARRYKRNVFHFMHRLSDGEMRNVDVYSTPVRYFNHEYLFSVIIDVTERKQFERKLLESEQTLKNYISSAGEGITLTDHNGIIIEWNTSMEKITGYKRSEVLGSKSWDVQHMVSANGDLAREGRDDLEKMIKDCLKTGKAPWLNTIFEREILDKKNKQKTVQTMIFPLKTGNGFMLASSMRDISYIKQMEQTKTDLEFKKRELATISVYLNQKNDLLNNIKRQVKYCYHTEDANVQSIVQQLEAMIDHNLNLDSDWKIYKTHFEKINEAFFTRLNAKHPGLTQNELRHCAYIRMNFTTKEIARINNVKPTSIQIARVRLKKRLNLTSETNLISYLLKL